MLGAILSIGSAIMGGLAGQSQANAQNAAINRQYKYDVQAWEYGKQRLDADWKHGMLQWEMNNRNEAATARWKNKTAKQDWLYQIKIQDHEYKQQMRQYAKSEAIYAQQLTFNNMAAKAANEAEHRKLQDATNEIAFKNQDIVIKSLEAEGTSAAKGQQGRSANKSEQSLMASLGRNQAILAESLISAKADTNAALRKIATDKYGADIAADAARMLKPERLPAPPKPIKVPRAEFLAPRKPQKYDYGPKPVKGAMASAAGSWANAASGVASGIAGLAGGGGRGFSW